MAKLKLYGAPTRTTPGAVGDIYIDMETGLEYRCTFAFRSPFFGSSDCEWKLTGNQHKTRGLRANVPDKIKEEVTEAVTSSVKSEKPKYVNYSKHSKKVK